MQVHDVAPHTKLIKLSRGEDMFHSLESYVHREGIANASFTAIGAAEGISCGYYDLEAREYLMKDYVGVYEVASMTGNIITKDNSPLIHVHAVFSDRDNQTCAGHVRTLTVAVTLEIVLTTFTTNFSRTYDEETGLYLINLD